MYCTNLSWSVLWTMQYMERPRRAQGISGRKRWNCLVQTILGAAPNHVIRAAQLLLIGLQKLTDDGNCSRLDPHPARGQGLEKKGSREGMPTRNCTQHRRCSSLRHPRGVVYRDPHSLWWGVRPACAWGIVGGGVGVAHPGEQEMSRVERHLLYASHASTAHHWEHQKAAAIANKDSNAKKEPNPKQDGDPPAEPPHKPAQPDAKLEAKRAP